MTKRLTFKPLALPVQGTRIAFSIPGEVTDGFLSQIAMFSLALRKAPPPLCDARILAYLGCEIGDEIPDRWLPYLKGVEFRLIRRPASQAHKIIQAPLRFQESDPDLDYVILCDADTLILGALDEVFDQLSAGIPVAGVIAHLAPYNMADANGFWRDLSRDLTGQNIALRYVYTLMHPDAVMAPDRPRAPFYVNHGFLAFRADALRAFAGPNQQMRDQVAKTPQAKFFSGQVATALSVHALGWTGAALPMRFNFPNDDAALPLHGYDAQDIRVLHYLRENNYKRSELFADKATFDAFLASDPQGADCLVADAIQSLTGGVYPFP